VTSRCALSASMASRPGALAPPPTDGQEAPR
jgi:hypothetical protein